MNDDYAAMTVDLEIIEPVGMRVLIKRDEFKDCTKAGIYLPPNAKIPTFAGRIMAISPMVEADPDYANLKQYQKVLVSAGEDLLVDFESGNRLVVVSVVQVVAIIGKPDKKKAIASCPA